MTVLLQLSDPHFGTERPKAMAALAQLCAELRPDLLLVTGDVTQRARPAQFARAQAFFDSLAVPTRLVIPGNHDIPLLDVFARAFNPYGRYAKAFGAALEGEFECNDLLVVAINTTRRHRHKHGEVSPAQVERVADRMARAGPDRLRLVAVHQPVAVVTDADINNLLRGHERAVHRWAESGVDAILGGHIHLPYVRPLRDVWPGLPHPVWAVQAGTALSHRVRGGISNSVNVVFAGPGRRGVMQRWDLDEGLGAFRQAGETVLAAGAGRP